MNFSKLAKTDDRRAMLDAMGVVVARLFYIARDFSILKLCVLWLPKHDRCSRRDGRRFIKVSAGHRLGSIAPTIVRGVPDMLLPDGPRDENTFLGVNTRDPHFFAFEAREPRPARSAGRDTMNAWLIREKRRRFLEGEEHWNDVIDGIRELGRWLRVERAGV